MASIEEERSTDEGTPLASNRLDTAARTNHCLCGSCFLHHHPPRMPTLLPRKRDRRTSSSDESAEEVTKKHKRKPLPRKRRKKEKTWSTSSTSSSSKTDQHHKNESPTESSSSSSRSSRFKPVRRVVYAEPPAKSESKSLYRRFLRSVVVTPSKPHFVFSGSARLLVTGLSYGTTEEDVANIFGNYGQRQLVRVHYNRVGRCTGSAEVRLESKFLIWKARQDLNDEKYTFRGRRIHVQQISSIPKVHNRNPCSSEDDD